MKIFAINKNSCMKLPLFFCIVMLSLFISTTSYSEFYQYTDEDGVIRYTDDTSTIPSGQRSDLKTYESVKSPPSQSRDFEIKASEDSYSNGIISESEGAGEAYQPESTEDSWKQEQTAKLDVMRKELRERYEKLNAMRKALNDARSGAKDLYIQRSEELNRQIEEYNQMNKEFEQQVKEYNSKINQK